MNGLALAELDHVVVNTLRGMDHAAGVFAGLGFTMTPLGRHSLGSINHLMMTPTAYLELVGVPSEGRQRQEVLDSPFGLSGLVFKTSDADSTFARLERAHLRPAEPIAFSRPVEIDGASREAKFRTVKVPRELFPAGRVYFCEHQTPELVWRPEWLDHPNGFCGIDRIEIASIAPEVDASLFAAAVGWPAVPSPHRWSVQLTDFRIDVVRAEAPRFVSMDLRFQGLDRLEAAATSLDGVEWRREADGTATIDIPSLELRIACRSVQ